MRRPLKYIMLALCLGVCLSAAAGDAHLEQAIQGENRSAEDKARDEYRKPAEVLSFFGIKKNMTVLEVLPGYGWYSEILGPYLKDEGQLIVMSYDRNPETQKPWASKVNKFYADRFVATPETYGKIKVGELSPNVIDLQSEDGSLDMVLDFRNAHNWIKLDPDALVSAWFKALKKGGIVGIVDHRWPEDREYDPGNGYLQEKQMIALMEKHGFKFVGSSEALANEKDTKDHPYGVWSLPPTLAGKEKDQDKFLAIGESDRFALKFVKP